MITSFIQGGLGNQLFQIAAGHSLALDLGVDFVLADGQHHLPMQGNNIATYRDGLFKNVRFAPVNSFPPDLQLYHEPAFSYKELPKKDNQALIGFFQSEKYFKHNETKLRELIKLPTFTFDDKVRVSLHIRQGDYLKNPEIHPVQSIDYYKAALDYIGDYDDLLIFSDVKDIPKEIMQLKGATIAISQRDYTELYMMSLCTHNIICNSTFSWWAAWFNRNKNKKVVAPSKWFGPKGPQDFQDIYCEGWKVI